MAKSRVINTKFWSDDYISHLDPIEKLLFLYFLTNPFTDISGVYEIPIKNIALDTGLDKEMVEKIVKRFERNGKIVYKKGWIAVKNFTKHQNLNNPQIAKGVELGLNRAPDFIKEKLNNNLKNDMTHTSVIDESSHSNSNSNSNLNPNEAEASSALVPEVINLFEKINPACKNYYGNKTQRKACEDLIATYGFDEISKVIDFLPRNNSSPFKKQANTPFQLWENYAAIKNGWLQEKNKKLSNARGLET